jgi:hypothetical protein
MPSLSYFHEIVMPIFATTRWWFCPDEIAFYKDLKRRRAKKHLERCIGGLSLMCCCFVHVFCDISPALQLNWERLWVLGYELGLIVDRNGYTYSQRYYHGPSNWFAGDSQTRLESESSMPPALYSLCNAAWRSAHFSICTEKAFFFLTKANQANKLISDFSINFPSTLKRIIAMFAGVENSN